MVFRFVYINPHRVKKSDLEVFMKKRFDDQETSFLDDSHYQHRFVGLFEDITSRKQSQEELERLVAERTRHLVMP